ncbi:CBASS cGAMP-activated phospholipase [Euryhalocaulis caribicus]|uniref:CBASS cGAMP-activated phospholipase n=1 Tax=Euryhalocaulis caribicus TaxID=1161401 RepID=UPI0003B6D26A|nr:CBASS cGAMP-activated phospholipase [Euryhalocaulis caribicus]
MKLLCLSGGGYLGLFTAAVLDKLEQEHGQPLARYFDLIAGTSIGGILALALANEVRMESVVDAMVEKGPALFGQGRPAKGIFGLLELRKNACRPKYKAETLRDLITSLIQEDVLVGDLKHRVLIPSVNLTKGSPQIFKTGHHPTFVRDPQKSVVDVALATSAAPTFFGMHTIGNERFADGGVYANSPDLLALHEATHFLGAKDDDVSILSIGTTSTNFSMAGSTKSKLGWAGWMKEQRLTSVMISSQQMMSDFMLKHKLGERYLRIDRAQSKEQERELSLDTASKVAQDDLRGLAEAAFQEHVAHSQLKAFFAEEAKPFES